MWRSMFGRTLSGKKKKSPIAKVGIGILIVYVLGALCAFFAMTYSALGESFIANNLSWLYFSFAGLMSVGLCLIGSIFTAQTQLFDAKDNELLLSMPIPSSYIIGSRFLAIGVINYVYALLVIVPSIFVYGIFAPITPNILICFIIATILLPIIPLVLSCLVGWIIAAIASKVRRKNLISGVFMVVFFVVYMYLFTNVQNYLQDLIANGEAVGAAIQKAVPPLYYFGTAIANSSFVDLLLLALWCIVPLIIIYYAISKSFIKIATAKKGFSKKTYKAKEIKVSTPFRALFKRELSRFTSLPMYMLNSGLGVLLMLLAAGYLIVDGKNMITEFGLPQEFTGLMAYLLCIIVSFCCVMTSTTNASISLEGKNLWIIKSMPITPKTWYLAKICLNLVISLPAVIITAIAGTISFNMTPVQIVILFLIPTAIQVFAALFGLMANIKLPRFEWVNEISVVKQSGSVFLSIFGGMAVLAIPLVLYVALLSTIMSVDLYLICVGIAFVLVDVILYRWIMTKGIKLYQKMG